MNYIELINQFWRTRRSKRITGNQADLYYCLLQECNERGWENPFEFPNRLICAKIGMSEPTLITSRARLKQLGLIDFKSGKSNQSPEYVIIDASEDVPVQPKAKKKRTAATPPGELFAPEKGKKAERKKKEFVPPTLQEVLDFFSGSLLTDWETQARLFYTHYDSQGWRKSSGVLVTNWDSLGNKWILDEKIKQHNKHGTDRRTQRQETDAARKEELGNRFTKAFGKELRSD